MTTTAGAAGSSTSAGATGTSAGVGTTFTTLGEAGSCVLIPEETAGPYPLDLSGEEVFVRTDITEGRLGVPLTLILTLVNASADCAPNANARVDLWHCDAEGVYSGYSQPGSDTTYETFCRGIQVSDSNGQVTFQTIYPGWYQGRITHIHFQVFLDNGLAATSQIAFPPEITDAVYAVDPYAAKGPNTSVTSFADDNVFSDGTNTRLRQSSAMPARAIRRPSWLEWLSEPFCNPSCRNRGPVPRTGPLSFHQPGGRSSGLVCQAVFMAAISSSDSGL